MKKNQSFHIITKGSLTQKGDFIGSDIYNNSIFISSKTKLLNNVTEISEDYPLFCLAKVEEVFNKKVNGRKLHFLKCYYAEFDLIKMLSAITDDFVVEFVHLNDAQVDNFMLIKSILDEYNFFKEKKPLLAASNIGFNRNKDEENYELPFLLLSSGCLELKQKLDKYINFFGYEKEIKEIEYDTYFEINYEGKTIVSKGTNNSVFKIDLCPLYWSIKTINKLIDRKSEEPIIKIITKSQLLNFDKLESDYFSQFYDLINSKYDVQEDKLQYHLEHPLEFNERLKNSFESMYVYAITPLIPENKKYGDSFEKIHEELLELVEYLEKIKIFNVVIHPPVRTYYEAKEHIDYYLYPPDEDLNNSFDGWAELGDQEMNRMDEETDGFWRY